MQRTNVKNFMVKKEKRFNKKAKMHPKSKK